MVVRVEAQVSVTWWLDPFSNDYGAACEQLGLTAAGLVFDDLCQDVAGAIQAVFHRHVAAGNLTEFLEGRGWATQPAMHARRAETHMHFDLPFNLVQIPPPVTQVR